MLLMNELCDAGLHEDVMCEAVIDIPQRVSLCRNLLGKQHGTSQTGTGYTKMPVKGRSDDEDVQTGLLLTRGRIR